jgi:hypothetical protein
MGCIRGYIFLMRTILGMLEIHCPGATLRSC